MHRIAFVIQRYGADISGGSEALCRAWAERLAARGHAVHVFTSCARDFVTWADHYPPGVQQINGVEVQRFPVDEPRDIAAFDALTAQVYGRPYDPEREQAWMRAQGPYSTPLFEALGAAHAQFDLFIFMTYLYSTTCFGLSLVADKAVLAPTAHDEPPIYLGSFRRIFALPRAFFFLMPSEEILVRRRFDVAHIPGFELGLGVDLPAAPPPAPPAAPLTLLYLGRVHPSKGVDELLAYLERYRAEQQADVRLILAGKVDMPLPAAPWIRVEGFVSEARKAELLAACHLLLLPSYYESLSIAILEAWAAGRPTLVNGAAAVLREQSLRSGGGLFYTNYAEFAATLATLSAEPHLRERMACQGRAFVARRYSWEVVDAALEQALEAVLAGIRQPALEPGNDVVNP
jgi:glycosyltransferase involved in cell wall biosynthesis